jgi:hypothetical protein
MPKKFKYLYKKFPVFFVCVAAIVLITLQVFTIPLLAWDDCPFDKENDEYPGECPRYVDTDGDGICDRSQPAPEDRVDSSTDTTTGDTTEDTDDSDTQTDDSKDNTEHEELYSVEISGQELRQLSIQKIADLWFIDSNTLLEEITDEFGLEGDYSTSDVLDTLREEYKFSSSQIKDIAEGIKARESLEEDSSILPESTSKPKAKEDTSPYNIVIPLVVPLILYLTSWIVSKKMIVKKFNLQTHNAIWNTVLIITLVPSAVFGLYLALRYSLPEIRTQSFDFMYWHVEGSIVMATVVTLHLIQRLVQYFAQLKNIWRR